MEIIYELSGNSKRIKKIRFSKPTNKIMKKQIPSYSLAYYYFLQPTYFATATSICRRDP